MTFPLNIKNIKFLYSIRNKNLYTSGFFYGEIGPVPRSFDVPTHKLIEYKNNFFDIVCISKEGYGQAKYINNTEHNYLSILSSIGSKSFIEFGFIDRIFYYYVIKKSKCIIHDYSYSNLIGGLDVTTREDKFNILLN